MAGRRTNSSILPSCLGFLLVIAASQCFAHWQIRQRYHDQSNVWHDELVGNFATQAECEDFRGRNYIDRGWLDFNCSCVGSDSVAPKAKNKSSGDISSAMTKELFSLMIAGIIQGQMQKSKEKKAQIAREAEQELARTMENERLQKELEAREFQEEKKDLTDSLKSDSSNDTHVKGVSGSGAMKLKTVGDNRLVLKKDPCTECGELLFNGVRIGLERSALPEQFIGGTRAMYRNCMIKESGQCDGTWGRALFDILALCETREQIEVALASLKGFREGAIK